MNENTVVSKEKCLVSSVRHPNGFVTINSEAYRGSPWIDVISVNNWGILRRNSAPLT